jgi:hypothetical protein
MNLIVIASIVVAGTIVFGALLAILFRGFNRAVVNEQQAAEIERQGYNAGLTYGFKIPVEAETEVQLKAARKEAARRAALLPRGANVGIAQGNTGEVQTAYKGVQNDPVSAVKIAAIHSWEGLRSGASFSPGQTLTHADAVTAPPARSVEDLVPGKDYPAVEITEEMTPAEKRKARIANAKAKSAASKALKASATPAPAAAAGVAAEQGAVAPSVPPAAAPAAVAEPVAGVDYEVIEITDDMAPDEVRKARIANVKAKSAAMKAFKAAGGAATPASAPVAQPEAAASPEPAADMAPPATAASVAPPELTEITEDMSPEDVRRARIQNAKAKAAYKKALKEAGIDPSTV